MESINYPEPDIRISKIEILKKNLLRHSKLTEQEAEQVARKWIQKDCS